MVIKSTYVQLIYKLFNLIESKFDNSHLIDFSDFNTKEIKNSFASLLTLLTFFFVIFEIEIYNQKNDYSYYFIIVT